MKELIFKVVIKKEIEINLSIDEIRRFQTYNTLYSSFDEKMIIIEYHPVKGFDIEGYTKMIKAKIKRDYKAHSVEVLDRELKEIQN